MSKQGNTIKQKNRRYLREKRALLPYGSGGLNEIRENFAKLPVPVLDTILRDAPSKKLQQASTEQVGL